MSPSIYHCFALLAFACVGALRAEEPAVKAIVRGNLLAPKAFRAAAARMRPSIVSIETFGGVTGGGSKGAGAALRPGDGPTTGVVISAEGYVLTSTFNFLTRPPIITVVFADGQRHVAKLLGRDETRKLCLLKVDGVQNLEVPPFATPADFQVGQWAIALGVGFGESEPALSAGIISALNRVSGRAIQTDANLSPANYGGPLVDIEGRLIGICVPLSPGSKEAAAGAEWYDSGIGFAVPVADLEPLLARLKAGETLRHGFLGVQAVGAGEPPAGAVISKVLPGSAAEKAGLQEKDQILQVAGVAVLDVTHLSVLISKGLLGDKITLEIERGGERKQIEVVLGEMPTPPMAEVKPGEAPPAKPGDAEKEGEPKPPEEKPAPSDESM